MDEKESSSQNEISSNEKIEEKQQNVVTDKTPSPVTSTTSASSWFQGFISQAKEKVYNNN
jgi:hypothetical protein